MLDLWKMLIWPKMRVRGLGRVLLRLRASFHIKQGDGLNNLSTRHISTEACGSQIEAFIHFTLHTVQAFAKATTWSIREVIHDCIG